MWTEPIDEDDRWSYGPNDSSGVIVAEVRFDGTHYNAALLPRHTPPAHLGGFDTIEEAKAAVVEALR